MYERFYGLRERPFALSPDPDYLYPSRVHSEALDYLRYGLESHAGFIVITGEIGSGKTTLLQALLRGLDSQTTVGRIVNTMLDPRELLETIMIDFGLDPGGRTKPLLLRDLAQYLVDQRIAGRMVLLVIDEAQNLTVAALEELRMLSNLETEKSKLLQIVLVGQPNLREKLAAPELEQLRQRITVSYHLMPLDAEETANYINHRLRRAALGVPPSFPREVTNEIHARSRGVPRVVNVICDAALVFGYAEERRQIDLRLMHDVLSELETTGVLPAQADMPAPSEVPGQPAAAAMQPRSIPASIPASGRDSEVAAISPRMAPPTPAAVMADAAPARTPVAVPAPQPAPAPSPMPAHAAAALANTSQREPVEAPRPKPVEPARPTAVQPPRHQPLEAPRPERVEVPRPSPVEAPRPAPAEGPRPERVEVPRPERVEAPSPAPEHVVVPRPEHVEAPRPERVEGPRPSPGEQRRPEPRPERIEGLRPVAAVSTPPPPAAAVRIDSSYPEPLSAHAARTETVTADRLAAPRERFLVDAPFRPTREEQIRIAEAEAAARAALDARLAQREAAIRQRERELAEQRRILAEEYRLLRSQRAAVSAAAGLSMGARSVRVDLHGAQPNDRSAFSATRPEGSFWAWLKRLVGASRPVEGMTTPR